jgi:hypothetical protein
MKDRQDVLKEIAHLHSIGINPFFNFGSGQDAKDSIAAASAFAFATTCPA